MAHENSHLGIEETKRKGPKKKKPRFPVRLLLIVRVQRFKYLPINAYKAINVPFFCEPDVFREAVEKYFLFSFIHENGIISGENNQPSCSICALVSEEGRGITRKRSPLLLAFSFLFVSIFHSVVVFPADFKLSQLEFGTALSECQHIPVNLP